MKNKGIVKHTVLLSPSRPGLYWNFEKRLFEAFRCVTIMDKAQRRLDRWISNVFVTSYSNIIVEVWILLQYFLQNMNERLALNDVSSTQVLISSTISEGLSVPINISFHVHVFIVALRCYSICLENEFIFLCIPSAFPRRINNEILCLSVSPVLPRQIYVL